MKFKVQVGQRYNMLVVLENLRSVGGHVYWRCKCDCGQECETRSQALISGHRKSCGCLHYSKVVEANTTHGFASPNHPKAGLYTTWRAMKRRCCTETNPKYPSYGGRGIKIEDPRWMEFEGFKTDMEPTWKPGLSIERKENNRGYCKDNCVWATAQQQALNTRRNRNLEFNGKTQPLAAWATEQGIRASVIWNRLDRGWTVEKALTTPG